LFMTCSYESPASSILLSRFTSLLCILHRIDKRLWWLLPVSIRIILSPVPQVSTRILQRELRLPAQLRVGECGIGSEVEYVTVSSRGDLVWQVSANDVAKSLDHVKDGGAFTRAQIPGFYTRMLLAEVVERRQVAIG
jgi:hypothetical protein